MRKVDLRVPLILVMLAGVANAQIASARNRNNPYSPSPDGRSKTVEIAPAETVAIVPVSSAAGPPRHVVEPVVERPVPLTELYKVGLGDVLLIELANVSQGHGYYTVRPNGAIDYQLAGGEVIVADKSPASIARELASRISLFPDPEVRVSVREYGSHKITVSGMVDHPGEKNLQREAIPLFVIAAEAGVQPGAGQVVITRAPLLKPESFLLKEKLTDDVLIYPGNSVEFIQRPPESRVLYFITGQVLNAGQKELTPGQTLYQAIAAAGGTKGSQKRALIRRKDDRGVLSLFKFDLRAIRDGKATDPQLRSGDVVEIGP
ncbi:MAG: polysaccharide biosynthesis/export family protein [Chloracidobacterium sp.]|nr:polysaccharide biosynthesis/export family protein [Chloracidobacterium sp.]